MNKTIKNKISILILILILLTQTQIYCAQENDNWWDNKYFYRQEIKIPIDTKDPESKYQPVDTNIIFDNPCCAESETSHSIRVIIQNKENCKELESQIYDLDYTDQNHIKSCNIVFLIPQEADGSEKYYIYYDDDEKTQTNYPDHVSVEEAYYLYEPIPVFPFELCYYKIKEGDNIIYAIAYDGKFLGYGAAQQITKFVESTKEVTSPQSAESWASFDYFYNYGEKTKEFRSTIEKPISKKIYIDGNLMVKIGINSETSNGDFWSSNIYKYYYYPVEDKKIYAHIKHEARDKTKPISPDSSGNIAGLQVGFMKSPSVKELNFGKMFPYIHVCSEDNSIIEYKIDLEPEYTPDGITILDHKDDIDLGLKSWSCFDYGETGESHGVIIGSTNIIKQGVDERDGVQVLAVEGATPGLLGLKTSLATIYFSRNLYEKGSQADLDIPKDLIVEYDALFFSSKNGGYKAVDKQAEIFQSLLKIMSSNEENNFDEEKEHDKYCLTACIHLEPSFPMGTLLSLITGKNFSYISAELNKDEQIISSDIAKRILIKSVSLSDDDKPLDKFLKMLSIFDLKNFSFFKKVYFKNIPPGEYVLKIYKEKSLLNKERKFIGFKKIVVEDNTSTHVFCTSQGMISVEVFDKKLDGVKGVEVKIISNNTTVNKIVTDETGCVSLKAPIDPRNSYTLRLYYNGFIIHEESLKLGFTRTIVPIKKQLNVDLYDLELCFKDTLGLTPEVKLNPVLTSKDMAIQVNIYPEETNTGCFIFNGLLKGDYSIELNYKSYFLKQDIMIPCEKKPFDLFFNFDYLVKTTIFNNRGLKIQDAKVVFERDGKEVNVKCNRDGFSEVKLPHGIYNVKVFVGDDLVGRRKLDVISDRSFDIVTILEPVYPLLISILVVISFFVFSFLTLKRKKFVLFIKGLVVCLMIISVISPWWSLHGSSIDPSFDSYSDIYLLPPEIISITKTSNVITGERASNFITNDLLNIMMFFSIVICLVCLLLFLNVLFEKHGKKKLAKSFYLLSVFLIVACILVFYFGISMLAKTGVGTFIGSDNLDYDVPGEDIKISAYGSWGPGLGFYLCAVSSILLVTLQFFKRKIILRLEN